MTDAHPLDRPIWTALTTRRANLATGDERARRFLLDVSHLAAPRDTENEALAALAALVPMGDDISLLEPVAPRPPGGLEETLRSPCVQMVARAFTVVKGGFVIEPLGDGDAAEMLELALLTRPGPFRARTPVLGRFVGIRDGGRLVAMAGERLAAPGFTEISGVCTHPDYRGRGYGAALMVTVGDRILAEGDVPFLHARAENAPAIALYRRLGFEVRAEILHLVWRRA